MMMGIQSRCQAFNKTLYFNTLTHKNMTRKEIRNLPVSGDIEINLDLHQLIADTLRESLENGDANQDMRELYGTFMNQMLDVLEEFDAPEHIIEEVTR